MASNLIQPVLKKFEFKDLRSYIKSLPQSTIVQLYNYPAACLAVFRELPELAKLFVMRLLFLEQPVTKSVVLSWINTKHSSEKSKTLDVLKELYIFRESSQQPGLLAGYKLDDAFKKNLKVVLCGGGGSWLGVGLQPDKYRKDIAFLDAYAKERWEYILHYMVRSQVVKNSNISRDVIDVLTYAGLILEYVSSSSDPYITAAGFQFLLMDTPTQVWTFLLKYLERIESNESDLVECLSLLLTINFLTLGKDYLTDKLSERQQIFLQHLREFGLVFQRKRKCQRFYPTRLAVNMISGSGNEVTFDTHKQGYIIVETSYRVSAYTDSALQINLLALFCKIHYRFPNVVIGNITRESCREAFNMGITAEQIIRFLQTHAHPEASRKKPAVPHTVTDQIMLWELERDRFRYAEGVMYSQFNAQSDFDMLRDYAKQLDVLIWENAQTRMLMVT
ncbi:hypothetical protein HELRODRAFT_69505, partial [Helobdella robusta]|uniref:General transcription factor IIH subunit 4 n=1 Tax=Helobdella robusta TaxID=6412 RepID=T1FZW1_HELRO